MNEKYQKMLDIGIEVMNKFSCDTKEYQLGQKIVAFACERNREEQKARIVFEPPMVGSLEEKLELEAFKNSNE